MLFLYLLEGARILFVYRLTKSPNFYSFYLLNKCYSLLSSYCFSYLDFLVFWMDLYYYYYYYKNVASQCSILINISM